MLTAGTPATEVPLALPCPLEIVTGPKSAVVVSSANPLNTTLTTSPSETVIPYARNVRVVPSTTATSKSAVVGPSIAVTVVSLRVKRAARVMVGDALPDAGVGEENVDGVVAPEICWYEVVRGFGVGEGPEFDIMSVSPLSGDPWRAPLVLQSCPQNTCAESIDAFALA